MKCLFILLPLLVIKIISEPLIVHVIPHSHLDPGWLDSYEDNYIGNARWACVRCVYKSVLKLLNENYNRTFVIAEVSYFSKWYNLQSKKDKSTIKDLIRSGRIEFVHGGWVEQDEATTLYKDIILNMRVGMQFLKKEFNITVETAWGIDSFDYSSSNVLILFNKKGLYFIATWAKTYNCK